MLYDFGKWQRRGSILKPQAQRSSRPMCCSSIITVAHETANAIVQTRELAANGRRAAEERSPRWTTSINLSGSAAMKALLRRCLTWCKPKPESGITPAFATGAVSGNLDSAKASLMSWLGWNSLNGINNDFSGNSLAAGQTATPVID